MHIWLIDDEIGLLDAFRRYLRTHGHETVETFGNPYRLIAQMRKFQKRAYTMPELIISDGEMNCMMNGVELHQALKEEGLLRNTRFILYTGSAPEFRAYCEMHDVPIFEKPHTESLLNYLKSLE